MYLLRGALASLGGFFLAYFALSAVLVLVWKLWGERRATRHATVLYAIRILPMAFALAFVAGLTVPSFLRFEPRAAGEPISGEAFLFALAGALVLTYGFIRSTVAWLKTSKLVSCLLRQSSKLEPRSGVRSFELKDGNPLFFVAGVWRPSLLVSSGAVALLDKDEIEVAIRHELAHARRRDNLKKLFLRFCTFPFLETLEREWVNASEIEADDAAVRDEREALALASALVKMVRGHCVEIPDLVMTFVASETPVGARIERLLCWKPAPPRNCWPIWIAVVPAVCAVLFNYIWALSQAHSLTELLIR